MSDSQHFDPRFDPAFQRGFVGEVGTGRRRATAGAPSVLPAAPTAVPASVPAPHPSPAGVATVSLHSSERADQPSQPVRAEETAAAESAESVGLAPPPGRSVNPWTVSIAVVGALLILGGLAGVSTLIGYLNSAEDGNAPNFYLTLIGMFASPLATALGVACFIGLLFLRAVRRR